MGWDASVHVNLRQQLMLRTRGVGGGGVGCYRSCELAAAVDSTHTRGGGGGVGWDVTVHVSGDDDTDDDDADDDDDDDADDDDEDDDDEHDPNETC